jgi:hypothetical protein
MREGSHPTKTNKNPPTKPTKFTKNPEAANARDDHYEFNIIAERTIDA